MKTITRPVVIIGAGISGCSTAIQLLKKGIKPLLIDRASFPRDTVGEGLSPAIGDYLKELGILDDIIDSDYVTKKKALQIVSPSGHIAYTEIDLNKPPYSGGLHSFPYGFNVRRKYFDYIFYEKAKKDGAEVWLKSIVDEIIVDNNVVKGVIVTDKFGQKITVNSNVVIDCSGRISVLAKQLGLRAPLEKVFEGQWANFAIRLHFSNCNMSPLVKDNKHYDPATVNIIPWDDCWYWFIPIDLKKGIISIGFVARSKLKKRLTGFENRLMAYKSLIEDHPILRKIIKGATLSDNVATTSRLGHMNTKMAGNGFLCVGDSAFFADPAWGTGVTICLKTSFMAAKIVNKSFENNDFSENTFIEYENQCRNLINSPFNSIRAYNYYYNDSEYVDFIIERLSKNKEDMDMIGAVLFDYIEHEKFQSWTFNEFKAFVKEKGRVPILNRVSKFDFDHGEISKY